MGKHAVRVLVLLLAAGALNLALQAPAAAQGDWTPTTTAGAPAARASHVAVWTGSKMLVWGGTGTGFANAGGIYDPAANSWAAITTSGAPTADGSQTAVWTGSKMLVWGGLAGTVWGGLAGTGGLYDPATNKWSAISTAGAPTAREGHTAVWTGSKMIVWGGRPAGPGYPNTNTGGTYDPTTNSWTATDTTGAPTARVFPTAVWARSKMVVWGGNDGDYINTGGVYNPVTGTWSATATSGAPSGRQYHTAVWTGSRMVAWGGAARLSSPRTRAAPTTSRRNPGRRRP